MKNFTLRISSDLDQLLEMYMKKNNISSKNLAINNMIEYYLKNNDRIISFKELDKKMERLLKLESLNNNLLEQLFSNHGFAMNLDKKEDAMLKETYDNIRKKLVIFMD